MCRVAASNLSLPVAIDVGDPQRPLDVEHIGVRIGHGHHRLRQTGTAASHDARSCHSPRSANNAKVHFAALLGCVDRGKNVRRFARSTTTQRTGLQPGCAGADAGNFAELPEPDRARRAAVDGGGAAAHHRGVRSGRDVLRLRGRHPAGGRAARGDLGSRRRHRRRPRRSRRHGQLASRARARDGQSAPALPADHRAVGGGDRGQALRQQRQRRDHDAARGSARLLLSAAELPSRARHRRRGPHHPDADAPRRAHPRAGRPADQGARCAHQATNRPGRHGVTPLRP